jgi:hypothetical protein
MDAAKKKDPERYARLKAVQDFDVNRRQEAINCVTQQTVERNRQRREIEQGKGKER